MNKIKKKVKISISIDSDIYTYLNDNFENKSKYVEYLIYKDMKENGLLKNDIIL